MTEELFLDTTYVMPFLYLDIDVDGYSRDKYREIIGSIDKVHISIVSIIEAKACSLRIEKRQCNEKFNVGLAILSSDEKVEIHGYTPETDKRFNEIVSLGLGFFDSIILAQSYQVGRLLTEDSRLLQLSNDIEILNWKMLLDEF
ncbi:MAG: hypothetical protein QMC77_06820 [Methanocellales archaeon]|nr:hypothetical protein [Methanocellales archaeon]